jgi:tyrosine-protein kinase Etk/Wzc
LDTLALTEAQQRRQFFERQLKETKDNLSRAELALKSGGVEGDVFKSSPQAAVTAAAQLQAQIAAQEVKLASMRGFMTENAPEFRQSMVELQALKTQKSKLEGIGASGSASSAGGASDYIPRYREYKYYETLYELISKQYEIARLNVSQGAPALQVVDLAVEPETKSKPKKATSAIVATVAFGFLLLLYVLVAKAFQGFLANSNNAERLKRIATLIKKPKSRSSV